jgi:dihydroorotate dehydrogenase
VSGYRILRPLLFTLPPEAAHAAATGALRALTAPSPARRLLARRASPDPSLGVRRWGLAFPSPLGLAAGFDKAGSAHRSLHALGFGFVEIGTVTAHPQPGNPRPRLFRLPADRALVNRMGFNNAGAAAVAARLRRRPPEGLLGINLGKSRVTPLEEAAGDYLRSLELLEPHADYLVVNVSSPNTPGLRALQAAEPVGALLRPLLRRRGELAAARGDAPTPLLLKIAPDLDDAEIEAVVGTAVDAGVDGVIAVNTTISREGLRTPPAELRRIGEGGISGGPLRARALAVVARVRSLVGPDLPVVGVGGVASADDAWAMLRAGASLVQLYTGFVYGGPGMVRAIHSGLVERLQLEGAASVDEIVGDGAPTRP